MKKEQQLRGAGEGEKDPTPKSSASMEEQGMEVEVAGGEDKHPKKFAGIGVLSHSFGSRDKPKVPTWRLKLPEVPPEIGKKLKEYAGLVWVGFKRVGTDLLQRIKEIRDEPPVEAKPHIPDLSDFSNLPDLSDYFKVEGVDEEGEKNGVDEEGEKNGVDEEGGNGKGEKTESEDGDGEEKGPKVGLDGVDGDGDQSNGGGYDAESEDGDDEQMGKDESPPPKVGLDVKASANMDEDSENEDGDEDEETPPPYICSA